MRECPFQYAFSSENNLPSSKVYYLLVYYLVDPTYISLIISLCFIALFYNGVRITS